MIMILGLKPIVFNFYFIMIFNHFLGRNGLKPNPIQIHDYDFRAKAHFFNPNFFELPPALAGGMLMHP